jgi:hypothetical protein
LCEFAINIVALARAIAKGCLPRQPGGESI